LTQLILHTMSGVIEPLSGVDKNSVEIYQNTEGEFSLSFYIDKVKSNEDIFDLIQGKERIFIGGNYFTIDPIRRSPVGTTVSKSVSCRHEMFDLLKGVFQETVLSGNLRIKACLDLALKGTGLTYTFVGDDPASEEFESFGREKGLSLFQTIMSRFDMEYQVSGRHLTISKEISKVTDAQFRHGHNLQSISEDIDTTNVATYIKGFGDQDEESEEYKLVVEYESPNSHLYTDENGNKRLIHADYVYDDRFVHADALLENLKATLQDVPDYALTIEYVELKKNGWNLYDYALGDYGTAIHEGMGLDILARIVGIKQYPLAPQKSPVLELGNFKKSDIRQIASVQRSAKSVTYTVSKAQKVATQASQVAAAAQQAVEQGSQTWTQHMQNEQIHVLPTDKERWDEAAKQAGNYPIATKESIGLENVDNVQQATKTEFDLHVQNLMAHWTQEQRDQLQQILDNYGQRIAALESAAP
jgi:phage minor structural protein